MKLRLHGNTLRLRLSQSEVARLAEFGRIEDRVQFAPGQALFYSLESADTDNLTAAFDGGRIRVILPRAASAHWIESDETGIEGSSTILQIHVEKDFQCLHRDSPEDADRFRIRWQSSATIRTHSPTSPPVDRPHHSFSDPGGADIHVGEPAFMPACLRARRSRPGDQLARRTAGPRAIGRC